MYQLILSFYFDKSEKVARKIITNDLHTVKQFAREKRSSTTEILIIISQKTQPFLN